MVANDHKQVKLQSKYRALTYGSKTVPELKVSGVWLEAAGFKVGEQVTIIVRENELTITAIKLLNSHEQ